MTKRVSAFFVLALVVGATSASAQGHHGVPPGQAKAVSPASSHDANGAPILSLEPRALGAWLDDASLVPERSLWMTVSTNRWQSPIGSGNDSPIVDLVSGINDRVQVGATLPYSRFTDQSGARWSGLGDAYLTAKVLIRSADRGRVGVAVSPTLELSNSAVAFDPAADRTHWVLPVSAEWRGEGWRTYGSSGYFTRGAVFASGAFERTLPHAMAATASLTQSWTTSEAARAEGSNLSRRRTDVGGSLAWSAAPSLMLFASLGRTLSRLNYDSSRIAFNAGVSVGLTDRPSGPKTTGKRQK